MPFGAGSRLVTGYVIGLTDDPDFDGDDINLRTPQEIKAFLDDYVIGQEENNSAVLLNFSDWTQYDGIETVAEADGSLRFSYTFQREQI